MTIIVLFERDAVANELVLFGGTRRGVIAVVTFLFLLMILLGTDEEDHGATTPDVESIKANCESLSNQVNGRGTRTYPVKGCSGEVEEEILFIVLIV